MNRLFRGTSLKFRLMFLTLGPSVVALLVAGIAIFASETREARRSIVEDSRALGELTAAASTAALAFRDSKAMNEYLRALGSRSGITAACVFDGNGGRFASFFKSDAASDCPGDPGPDGFQFGKGSLSVAVPIVLEGKPIGSLRLDSDLSGLRQLQLFHANLIGAVILAAALLTFFLSAHLQHYVSRPILALSRVASKVSERKDYGIRAMQDPELSDSAIASRDEVAQLVHSFDQMLEQIQRQDIEKEEAVRVRDDFMSIASHELKTPITPLQLQVQLIRRMVESGEINSISRDRLRGMLQGAERQVGRFASLIDDLLDTTRISAGKLELHPEEVNISKLLHEILERYAREISTSGSRVEVYVDPALIGKWDRSRLDQVVTNLLTNALKYGNGKEIRISAAEASGRMLLRVKDGGIGIGGQDQARIFERFGRAVSARHFGGLGLGLYISDRIVAAHGGKISVSSQPGQGSEFLVELPLRVEAGSQPRKFG